MLGFGESGFSLFGLSEFIPFPYGTGEWRDIGFPWSILAAGAILMIWQFRVWRGLSQVTRPSPEESEFLRRRCFRRTQIAFLLMVTGILLVGGRTLFPDTEHPGWAIIYWTLTMLLTLWLIVLAAADLTIGVLHFSRLKHRSDLEQIRLSLLADRIRRVQGNGKHRPAKNGEAQDTKKEMPEG